LEGHTHTFEDCHRHTFIVGSESVDVNIYDTDLDPSGVLPRMDAAMVVFSIASRESFQRLEVFSRVFTHFRKNGGLVCLVGTHTDVGQPQVSPEEGSTMARSIGAKSFRVCVKNCKDARMPWEFLLHQWHQPKTQRVIQMEMVETPAPLTTPTPTPTETMVLSVWDVWPRCLGSIGICLGLRKPMSDVWYN